jgi:hypothetical protein
MSRPRPSFLTRLYRFHSWNRTVYTHVGVRVNDDELPYLALLGHIEQAGQLFLIRDQVSQGVIIQRF